MGLIIRGGRMAIDNKVPEIGYLKKINSDGVERLCYFKYDKLKEITFIKSGFFKMGSPLGKIRLHICPGQNLSNILYSSDEVNISLIDPDILGDLRFDFDRSLIKKDKEYLLIAEIVDYLGDEENFFSFVLDFPMTVNDTVFEDINKLPARVEILAR